MLLSDFRQETFHLVIGHSYSPTLHPPLPTQPPLPNQTNFYDHHHHLRMTETWPATFKKQGNQCNNSLIIIHSNHQYPPKLYLFFFWPTPLTIYLHRLKNPATAGNPYHEILIEELFSIVRCWTFVFNRAYSYYVVLLPFVSGYLCNYYLVN